MKKLLLLLLFPFLVTTASHAQAQGKKPHLKAKRNYAHTTESSKGKKAKAHFRPENNVHPIIDFNPRRQGKFKTTKAAKNYKFTMGV
ncbi:hypothetical protein AUC43_17960 [Hymenobacter sedentarius]|uniref:Uncharacterized protein n=1 Tax=Hymenobacter sedentarius TaxID=1411621 RepID=A0A0U4ATK4_9BACT|nr:hypothetical protein [Hymenobacter sedentarius]ALW86800.1 hypothetical protein AUC43_17960 [Hymenobacter sedentarius]